MKKTLTILFAAIILCVSLTTSVSALTVGWITNSLTSYVSTDKENTWYDDARDFVIQQGLMRRNHTESKVVNSPYIHRYVYINFLGNRQITRSEVATILSRYDGKYDTLEDAEYEISLSKTFTDVPSGKWMTPAVEWAAENGIVEGVGGTSFAPKRNITREEFAAILYRYTQFKEVKTDKTADLGKYSDGKSVSNWAKEAMSWAVAEGLITGKPGGLLAPKDNITRAEVAVVIYRYNNTILAHNENYDKNGQIVYWEY